MSDDAKLNAAAYLLMKDPNQTAGRVFGHLIQQQLETIMSTQPNEVEKREVAYHTLNGLKNASALIENMAALHDATLQNRNPA